MYQKQIKILKKLGVNYINLKQYETVPACVNDIYILSAVRTPIGSLNGSLSEYSVPQLGGTVLKEALLRALVPPDDVENVFMACVLQDQLSQDISQQTLSLAELSNTVKMDPLLKCGMLSVVEGVRFLQNSRTGVCIAGGMESMSNSSFGSSPSFFKNTQGNLRETISNSKGQKDSTLVSYVQNDCKKLIAAYQDGAFGDELVKIVVRKRGFQTAVSVDDKYRDLDVKKDLQEKFDVSATALPSDGAAALVLATENYVNKNNLTPLAKVISIANEASGAKEFSAPVNAIKKALEKAECRIKDIAHWEINDYLCTLASCCAKRLNLDRSLVNKHGGGYSLGYPAGMSGTRLLCHLAHSLSVGELGCAVTCNPSGRSLAVVIEKVSEKISDKPSLTLYTKYPCPLCDELQEQIEPFEDRFSLKEVDIKSDGNDKYRKLFRYDIPVVFLDGRFLCKHRVDLRNFKRRLLQAEKIRESNQGDLSALP